MKSNSNAAGDHVVDAAIEWASYDALPPAVRRILSEANAKFPSSVVLNNFNALRQRGLTPTQIEAALLAAFDDAAHLAHLRAGSVVEQARGPLVPRRLIRVRGRGPTGIATDRNTSSRKA